MTQAKQQPKTKPEPVYTNTRLVQGYHSVGKHTSLTTVFTASCAALVALFIYGTIASIRDPGFGSEDNLGPALFAALLIWILALVILVCIICMAVRFKKASRREHTLRLVVASVTALIITTCMQLATRLQR